MMWIKVDCSSKWFCAVTANVTAIVQPNFFTTAQNVTLVPNTIAGMMFLAERKDLHEYRVRKAWHVAPGAGVTFRLPYVDVLTVEKWEVAIISKAISDTGIEMLEVTPSSRQRAYHWLPR